jgi:hypothetical protein
MMEDVYDRRLSALSEAMITAWQTAPTPPPITMPDDTRASRSDTGAAAVIWGWTARVMRMAEAALLLHRNGFDVEVAPLLRSMQDHAIALPWVVEKRGRAYQTLAREKANGWSRFQLAQERGWTLEGEAAELLRGAVEVETDQETFSENNLLKTLHRSEAYELGNLYQAWLLETWSTHATMVSAEPYFDVDPGTRQGRLFRAVNTTPNDHKVTGSIAIAIHTTLTCYEKLNENAFPGQLREWEAEFAEIMRDIKLESD